MTECRIFGMSCGAFVAGRHWTVIVPTSCRRPLLNVAERPALDSLADDDPGLTLARWQHASVGKENEIVRRKIE